MFQKQYRMMAVLCALVLCVTACGSAAERGNAAKAVAKEPEKTSDTDRKSVV